MLDSRAQCVHLDKAPPHYSALIRPSPDTLIKDPCCLNSPPLLCNFPFGLITPLPALWIIFTASRLSFKYFLGLREFLERLWEPLTEDIVPYINFSNISITVKFARFLKVLDIRDTVYIDIAYISCVYIYTHTLIHLTIILYVTLVDLFSFLKKKYKPICLCLSPSVILGQAAL